MNPEPLDEDLLELVDVLRGATPDAAELAAMQARLLGGAGAGAAASAAGAVTGATVGLKGLGALGLVIGLSVLVGPPPGASPGAPAGAVVVRPPPAARPLAAAPAAPAGVEVTAPAPPPSLDAPAPREREEIGASAPPKARARPDAPAAAPAASIPSRSAQEAPAADMVFEVEDVGAAAPPPALDRPPSEALASALRLYPRGEHDAAAVQLLRVLEGQTDDDRARFEQAQLVYAKALFHMGLYHASRIAFAEIARRGEAHRYFLEALPWLAQLTDYVPEPGALIEAIGHYRPEQLERLRGEETRERYHQLLYLLGRHRYEARALRQAIELFEQVPAGSTHYVPARFFAGISHVRARQARPAIAAFREVIRAVDDGDVGDLDEDARLRDLAWITLARVYYTASNRLDDGGRLRTDGRILGNAVDAWSRVPVGSEYWLDSLFEQSWALFLAGENDRALGRIHALQSPFFEGAYYPEAHVLRAVVLFQHCHLDEAEASVRGFHGRFDPVLADMRALLERHPTATDGFELLRRVRAGDADLSPRIAAVVRSSFEDRELLRHLAQVRSVAAEEVRVASMGGEPARASLSARLGQELAVDAALTIDTTGELVRYRLMRLVDHLQERMNEVDAVDLEIQTERRVGHVPGEGAPIRIVADQEHQVWPFDGEYWRDELPYYRAAISNRCGR